MELPSFRLAQPVQTDILTRQPQDPVDRKSSAEDQSTGPKPTPTVEEARAAAAAAEAAWHQTAMTAQLSADPTSAAAALMLASQAAAKSAQAQIVYAEARAQLRTAKTF